MKTALERKRGRTDAEIIRAVEWWLSCPGFLRRPQGADFMVWSYLFILAGMFDE
jgi:hypothetical protein